MSTIKLKGSSSGEAEVTVAAAAGTPTFTLPTTVGSANQLLKNSGTAGTLEYANNLNFDGSKLGLGCTPTVNAQIQSSGTNSLLKLAGSTSGSGINDGLDVGINGSDGILWNRENGIIQFATNNTERGRFTAGGDFHITGSLVMAAAGKGIDFSDTGDAAGATSELLDDYEEGTWTPAGTNLPTPSVSTGKYMKIGHIVHAWWQMEFGTDGGNAIGYINNLPYTSENSSPYCGGTAWDYRTSSTVNVHMSSNSTYLYWYTDVGNNCNGDDSRIEGKQFRACTTYRAA